MANIEQISVDELLIDTAQSRSEDTWTNDELDRRLVQSIESDGVLQPCLVRPVEMTSYGDSVDESYAIIAGSRRYNASVKAGHDTIPCNVIEADDLEAAAKSLKENEERKDLSQNEVANSIRMQYEMLNPVEDPIDGNPVTCQDCQFETDGSYGLFTHRYQAHSELLPEGEIPLKSDVQTEQCAVMWLAMVHYPDLTKKSGKEKVSRLLRISDLPADFRILLKNVEERTESEKATLERYGISRDREVSAAKGRNTYRSALGLYEDLKELMVLKQSQEFFGR
jgi:ParB-like partition proteins